jgi:membrane protease YdiL (CAAX protease family)
MGAAFAGLAIVAIAWAENTLAPWAPFFLVTIIATIALPLLLGIRGFAPPRPGRASFVLLALGLPIALQAFAGVWMGAAWPGFLDAIGVPPEAASGTAYSFPSAFAAMTGEAAGRLGWTPEDVQARYLGLILLWAGFGEELFYRGYVHATWRARHGVLAASLVAAALFAIRHAPQLALVQPYPWGAAFSWVAVTFVAGLALSWLYEKTGTLFWPIVVHYLLNLIPVAAAALGAAG